MPTISSDVQCAPMPLVVNDGPPPAPMPLIGTGDQLGPHVTWEDGRPTFVHLCNGTVEAERLPLNSTRWQADESTDTVEPSINCDACGTHGFWIRGDWMPAGT